MGIVYRWARGKFATSVLTVVVSFTLVFLFPQWIAAQVLVEFITPFSQAVTVGPMDLMTDGYSETATASLVVGNDDTGPLEPFTLTVAVDFSDPDLSWTSVWMNTDHCATDPDDYQKGFDLAVDGASSPDDWEIEKVEFSTAAFLPDSEALYAVHVRLVLIDQAGETAVCPGSVSPVRFHELPSGEYKVDVVATVSPL